MKIIVLCPYPEHRAPSQRLKFEQYYPSWRSAGFEVDVRPFWSEHAWDNLYAPGRWLAKLGGLFAGFRRRTVDLFAARRADLVYLHLEAAPLGPPIIERLIKQAGVPIVYDIDDLVYLPHSSRHNRFMRWLRAGRKVDELVRMATAVIVCTEHLRSYVAGLNDDVTDISSTIDTNSYTRRIEQAGPRPIVLGWSGSHSTSTYLHLLDDVLREVMDNELVSMVVIGDSSFHIEGVDLTALPWSLETEVADLSRIDIGLYPLPLEEWVLGKSGLKALQYMALGIPTVAQDVGAVRKIIADGENGFLVSTPDDWIRAIRKLIADADLRRRIGDAARETVVSRYSVRANEAAYLRVLKSALFRDTAPSG